MPLDLFRTLSGATTPGQSGPGSNSNEGVLRIPQGPGNTWTSPSDYLVSYSGLSLEGSYPSAEVQSVYSTTPVCLFGYMAYQPLEISNAKSIFSKTILFQAIQFIISMQFISQNSPISV